MSTVPKTPTRFRSRSEVKTPLTPALVSAMNNMSISPRAHKSQHHAADVSNPFLSRSRPTSPVKRAIGETTSLSVSLRRQASGGVIRKGGIETRLDVVSRDYVPQPTNNKCEIKRSRSTPASRERSHSATDTRDRFITNREDTEVAATLQLMHLDTKSASPGHTARLVAATGVPVNRRVLAYHEPPPAPSDSTLSQQRQLARPLYSRPGPLPSSTSTVTNRSRRIPTQPERVLDAPGMVDDFYLNIVSWSSQNVVAVALAESAYIWRADTGSVTLLGEAPDGTYVSSVNFSNDGAYLGVGLGTGDVQLWDVEAGQRLRTMQGHQGQIAVLSWHAHILSSGCGDGSIWHHDVRVPRHKVMELLGHTGEVCGLQWRDDGELLASGGNDNVVNIWDGRVGDVNESTRSNAKWTKRSHSAAVKAIAWCPWQPSLLASGGGTNDATIHIWNSSTGARLHSLKTPSQVTSIQWSPHRKEFLTTHGYPNNAIMVHAYPSLERVAEIRDAHDSRVLYSTISPGGDVVCTGAGDENLKFWRIWDGAGAKKKKSETKERLASSTRTSILSIR